MVGDKVEEVKRKGLGVNDHWQQMKDIMMEIAQDICGMTKGPRRHKETWWWNEEVAEAVRDKKIKYGKWKKENTEEARMVYKKSRQNAKRVFTARCYASAVLAMDLCLSVCLSVSVCLSQVGVLLKRLNGGSHKQHHTIPQRL